MVIDFHVHCFPDDIARRATESLSKAADLPLMSDGTVAGMKASMKRAGIDKSLILNIATKPSQTRRITQWSSSIQDDEIMAFGSVHPDSPDWEDQLKDMKTAGLKGIKFHPEYQDFYVDDPKMYPIYEKAAELGFIIIFHAGGDLGMPEPYHCTPDRMRRALETMAGATIVAAHMGGFEYWDDVERYLVGEDIFFDTSFSLHEMSPEQFRRMLSEHGYHRLLFASDSPWGNQYTETERFRNMDLTDEVRNAIMGGNAARLLGLTC
ncbi:MAG: amidohydrolase family protein [Clostridiaceae bacterium]|nr:amidohydrolase family protein [Clostridiaceae bacterium]